MITVFCFGRGIAAHFEIEKFLNQSSIGKLHGRD